MFIVSADVIEKRSKRNPLPELVVEHYPTDTTSIHWLYCYQATWEASSRFPFMDRRLVQFIPPHRRRAFVYFTNCFYRKWMEERRTKKPIWFSEQGYMEICYKCSRQKTCEEFCAPAFAQVKVNHSKPLRSRIEEFENQCEAYDRDFGALDFNRPVPAATGPIAAARHTSFNLLLDTFLASRVKDVTAPNPYKYKELDEIPQDQEEWWVA